MIESQLRKAASIADLKRRAKSRLPGFSYEYLVGGCNNDIAVRNNRTQLDQIYLKPNYLEPCADIDLSTEVFGQKYAAPFGVAPIGLSGIVWPRASEFQARTAHEHNIPFILSSVSNTSIEKAAELAKDNFWFQLYPPKDRSMRSDILKRCHDVGCKNLVVTVDVPSLSWRPSDIKNGLGVPPKITPKSIAQSAICPAWSFATLNNGLPEFATLKPYISEQLKIKETAQQVRHALREVVDKNVLGQIRDEWRGNLIVKGIISVEDAAMAVEVGADGVIVSNHGGRQLDAALCPAQAIKTIINEVNGKVVVMADSGVESGVDVGRYIASGAQMVFAGRAFMYGVAAFGYLGADHTSFILYAELRQLLEQLRCSSVTKLSQHLV